MAHDVFITYSSKDKTTADAICGALEETRIRCWYAPRNIRSGASWTASIMDGLNNSRIMILVWSANSNVSAHVAREVHHAFNRGITVIPFRIEDVAPSQELEYYLESVQWLDASTPPLEDSLKRLVEHIQTFIPTERPALEGLMPEGAAEASRNLAEEQNLAKQKRAEEEEWLRVEEERRKREEESRQRLEAEAHQQAEAETARKRAEEERQRLQAEQRAAEDERRRSEAEAARKATEQQVSLVVEAQRKRSERREAVRATDELGPAAQTHVSEVGEPRPPALPESTIKEIPKPIEPIFAPPTPQLETNLMAKPKLSGRKLFLAALALIPGMLVVAFIGVLLARPWLNQRIASQNQEVNSPLPVPSEQSVIKPDVPSKKRFTGDFKRGKALELVYGSYDAQHNYTRRKLTAEDLKGPDGPIDFNLRTVYTVANFEESFVQGGVQRYILITETVPAGYTCDGCAPLIGGSTFSQQGDGWQLDAATKAIATMGNRGIGPKGKLIEVGPDRYGVQYNIESTGQGTTAEAVVIIAETGETVHTVLVISEYSGSNALGCGDELGACWKYSSKMDFGPGTNAAYFDIKVTTSGTRSDGKGNIQRVNAVKKYTFVDGKYGATK